MASLKSEVIRCIQGESSFSKEMLAELITQSDDRCAELLSECEKAEAEIRDGERMIAELTEQYDEIISYADLYDSASTEARKMIINCLIDRVDVFEGYKLNVKFNFHLSQFFLGVDFDPTRS